jgi:hypothetical protein
MREIINAHSKILVRKSIEEMWICSLVDIILNGQLEILWPAEWLQDLKKELVEFVSYIIT